MVNFFDAIMYADRDTTQKWQNDALNRQKMQMQQMQMQKDAMQLQQMQQQQQRAQSLEQAFSMLGANASPQDFAMAIFEYGDPEQMLQAKQMFDDSTRKSMATQFNVLSSMADKNPKLAQKRIMALKEMADNGDNAVLKDLFSAVDADFSEQDVKPFIGGALATIDPDSIKRAIEARQTSINEMNAITQREAMLRSQGRADEQFLYNQSQDAINNARLQQLADVQVANMGQQSQPTSQAIQDQAKLIASSAFNAEDPFAVLTSPEALRNPTIKALVDSVNAGNYANDEARTQAVRGAIANYIPPIARNFASVGRDVRANGVPVVVIDPNTGTRTQLTKYKGGLYDQNGEQSNIPVDMAVPQEIINLSSNIKNLMANPPSQGRTALELASNKGLTSDITALSQRLSDYVGSTSQEDVLAYFEGNDIRVSDAQKTILRSMQQAISLLGTSKSQAWAETKELLRLYGGEKGGELDLTGALRNLGETLSEKYATNIESIANESVKASERSKLIQRNNEILDALDNLVPPETIKTLFAPTLKRYLSPLKSSSSGGEVMLNAQMQGNSIVPTGQQTGQQQGAIRLKVVRKPDGTLGVE